MEAVATYTVTDGAVATGTGTSTSVLGTVYIAR
jgi:hypothetical protein